MSSEERIVRPYSGVDRIGRVLDHAFVQMTSQHHLEANSTKRLVAAEYLAFPVQFWLAPDEAGVDHLRKELLAGLEEADLDPSSVEIVVLVSTPRLKYLEIPWRVRCDELDDARPHVDLTEGARPKPLQTPFGGCRIEAYVLLTENLDEAPLRPWRRGTWLARARFDIKTDLGDIGFTPLPLTADDRLQFGLPDATVRHPVVDDPFADASGADSVKLYVDEDLLNQLALQPSAPAAKAFQRQLFVDAMGAVVHAASRSAELGDLTGSDLDGTLIGRLIDRLAGPTSDRTAAEHRRRCEALKKDVEDDPDKVVGWVEAIVPGLRSGLLDLLRGETL